jgi:uncharacterized protein (TIGR03437 family)
MNNRVVRFPDPFSNATAVEPDAVLGQPDFSRITAAANRNTLNRPRAVAFDASGNLWVADSGNNRVVRFNASALADPMQPEMDLVVGQADFTSGTANARGNVSASGFDAPSGIAFDTAGNLYVSDFNNSRVLKFAGPFGTSSQIPAAATAVWGQSNFTTRTVVQEASATSIAGPLGIAVAGNDLYVASSNANRVLVFAADSSSGSLAKNVVGQTDFSSDTPNLNSFPGASANGLSSPRDVHVDPSGTVFVADAGNHRVLSFNTGSKTAARVWGQTDFSSNGANQVKASSISAPYRMAIDYSAAPYALYVVDAGNNRVLIWKDSARFRNGDAADLVIGQPDMRTATANTDSRNGQKPSRTSLSSPAGIAIDQNNGTVYIADSGNNRVLRFPRPVNQPGRITPDAVLGQSDFTSSTSAVVSASSLRRPFAVALGRDGTLFVADTGNHRVVEFAAGASTGASAIRVYGQPNMFSAVLPAQASAQTLNSPHGVYVDSALNLYVADTSSNRVLIFPNTQAAPVAGFPAAFVIGQNSFETTGGSLLKSPTDIGIDNEARIHVVDSGNHRILLFSPLFFLALAGGTPIGIIGQQDLSGTSPNRNAPENGTTPESLASPSGLFIDRQDTLYVADAGNHRVLHFLRAANVVNSATYQAGVPVAPGVLAAVFGNGFSSTSVTAAESPWPVSLANREVVINDEIRAPLLFINNTQINLQIPSSIPLGSQRIAVRLQDTGELVAGGRVAVSATSPGLFAISQDGRGQAAATNEDDRVNSASNPAPKGSIITLYGTGQGQVSPPVQDGIASPASPLSRTVTVPTSDGRACVASQPSMCVVIGNTFGDVQFSGLAPGFVGVWQINVRLPADVPSGNVPLRILINGMPSNVVTVAVR